MNKIIKKNNEYLRRAMYVFGDTFKMSFKREREGQTFLALRTCEICILDNTLLSQNLGNQIEVRTKMKPKTWIGKLINEYKLSEVVKTKYLIDKQIEAFVKIKTEIIKLDTFNPKDLTIK